MEPILARPIAAPATAVVLPWAARPPRNLERIALGGLTCGIGAALLVKGALGLGFFLCALLWLLALVALGGKEGWQRARARAWPIGPYLFFAAMVAVRACPQLQALNVSATVGLGLLLVHAWGGEPLSDGRIATLLAAPVRVLARAFGQGQKAWAQVAGPRVLRERLGERGRRVVVGVALAAPLLCGFAALLASADALFASVLSGALRASPTALVRFVAVAGLSAWLTVGLFSHALRRHTPRSPPPAARFALGGTEALVVLACVDALFGVFALVQLAGLFASPASLAARGIVWSDYARSGFFQLLAVTVGALGLLMFLGAFLRTGSEREARAVRHLAAVMVLLLGVVVASGLHRMELYERAFGFTRLRLVSQTFMCAMAGLLLYRALTLYWHPERFAVGLLVAAVVWLGALNFLNPDALIAGENLRRAATTGELDVRYLATLSDDAWPALQAARERGRTTKVALCAALPRVASSTDWRGWTVSTAAARRARAAAPAPCPLTRD